MSQIDDTTDLSDSDDISVFEETGMTDQVARLAAARKWQREQIEREDGENAHEKKLSAAEKNACETKLAAVAAEKAYEAKLAAAKKRQREQLGKEDEDDTAQKDGRRSNARALGDVAGRGNSQYVNSTTTTAQKDDVSSRCHTARNVEETPYIDRWKPRQNNPAQNSRKQVSRSSATSSASSASLHQTTDTPISSYRAQQPNSHLPTTKPQYWRTFQKTLPTKNAPDAYKLGPDSGSTDAFMDTAFDKGLPIVTGNRGKAPVAVMHGPKINATKQDKRALQNGAKISTGSIGPLTSTALTGGNATAGRSNGAEWSAEGPAKAQTGGKLAQNPRSGLREDDGRARSPEVKQVRFRAVPGEETVTKECAPKIGFAALIEKTNAASAGGKFKEIVPKSRSTAVKDRKTAPISGSSRLEKSNLDKSPPPKNLPAPGIKLTASIPSRKSSAGSKDRDNAPGYVTSVLKGNRKRTLGQIDHTTLFDPKQIISEAELERRKRQRRASHCEQKAQNPEDTVDERLFDPKQIISEAELEHRKCQRYDPKSERGAQISDLRGDEKGVSIDIPENPHTEASPALSHSSLFEDGVDAAVATGEGENDAVKEDDALPSPAEPLFPSSPPPQTPDATVHQANVTQDTPSIPAPRPTTARKTISPQILAALEAAAAAINNGRTPESENEGVSIPLEDSSTDKENLKRLALYSLVEDEILYHYHVIRSDFGPNISEARAINTVFGPYYTLFEANESAKMEAGRSYAEMFDSEQLEGRKANLGKGDGVGSEIGIVADAAGCQTWRCVRVGGRGVVAKVEKGIAPRDRHKGSIPDSAFNIPRKVWVAMHFFRPMNLVQSDLDDHHQAKVTKEAEEGDFVTLGAFTTPDLANKRAGQAVVGFRNEGLGDRGRDRIMKLEHQSEMRKWLVRLDEDQELLDLEVETEDGGVGRIWVVEIRVEGPRN